MTTPDQPLEVTIDIAASPEVVFAHFTDPERYVKWMGTAATLDASPGGTYHVHVRDGVDAIGAFEEVDPPHRLVFTWGWQGDPLVPPGSTRVEVTLEPHDGGTTVLLRHRDLPGPEQVDHHGAGWELYLGRLATTLTGGDPGPDPNATPPA